MSISMHIQNLDKFYKRFLKILSSNEIMMDGQMNGQKDGMIDIPKTGSQKLSGVSDHARLKPICSVTEIIKNAEILCVSSFSIILSRG